MKNLIIIVLILFSVLSFGQSKNLKGTITKSEARINNVSITVTVDSIEDIESTFSIEDIKSILEEEMEEDEKISFKIICNKDTMVNGEESYASFKVDGNTNNIEGFLTNVKKIKDSAINYYKNKN